MSEESKSLGVLMLDIEGLELCTEDKMLLSNPQVGGVILGLHGRNFESVAQLQNLAAEIRQCNERILIAVDQEGGRVQRFKDGFTRLPSMHQLGRVHASNAEEGKQLAQLCGWLMAAEILSCGLDLSFAPVLDLYFSRSRVIADRAFSADPHEVVTLGAAFVQGMHDAGMKATGKHFPGHGSVEADSHEELPVDPRSLEQLLAADIIPFQQCAELLDAVMPGHVLYPSVDAQCAAMSQVWLQQILRNKLGFNGVIFSDDLGMAAAGSAGSAVQRAGKALEAGCDMILVCNSRPDALATIDWLEANEQPLNARLLNMRGKYHFAYQALRESDAWLEAQAQVGKLTQ